MAKDWGTKGEQVGFRIPTHLKDRIQHVADRLDTTPSEIMRRCLVIGMDDLEAACDVASSPTWGPLLKLVVQMADPESAPDVKHAIDTLQQARRAKKASLQTPLFDRPAKAPT